MFKENELVMYGSTGVCRVKEIGRPSFVDKDDERIYLIILMILRLMTTSATALSNYRSTIRASWKTTAVQIYLL